MKKVAHILNIVTLILIAITNFAIIPQLLSSKDGISDHPGMDGVMAAGIYLTTSLVMVLTSVITGVFFPKTPTYGNGEPAPWPHEAVKNSHGDYSGPNRLTYYRFWEPVAVMIWMAILIPLGIFAYGLNNDGVKNLCIVNTALLTAHLIISFIWKMAWSKEQYGHYNIKGSLIPMACIFAFFSIIAAIVIINSNLTKQNNYVDLQKIQNNIAEIKEGSKNAPNSTDTEQKLDMNGVLDYIKNHSDANEKIYYKLEESSKDNIQYLTIITWTENNDDVVWYRFSIDNGNYYYDSSMKSDALKKSDLAGSEDGTI